MDCRSLDARLGFRVRMLEQAFMRGFARHMDPLEVTPTLYSILVLIRDNPLCRQSDLSHALNMHQPNLVERAGLLIARGLVARREDPTDRRASALELTFAGRHFMEKVTAAYAAYEAEMRQVLGPERYDALLMAIPTVERDGE
jgi:DNA-binding MarR family transcriptional regulator